MTTSSESSPMSRYAPVSITVYDRVDHLKQTIDALKANPEAVETVLYIFSDAARPGHEDKIEKVRAYISEIDGFAEVRRHFQTTNSYVCNIQDAREIPLRDFGRMIRMEDDIVVSPQFLAFMNEALDRYADDTRIFSISGYTPEINEPDLRSAFVSKDFSAWGYAIWADRNLTQCLERRDYYSSFKANRAARREVSRLHPLMLATLRMIEAGRANPNDYKASAHQFLSGSYSLKPPRSLVRNIGFDGSGMAGTGARTKRFETELTNNRPPFPEKIEYNPALDRKLFLALFPKADNSLKLRAIKSHIMSLLPRKTFDFLQRLKKRLLGRDSATQQRL